MKPPKHMFRIGFTFKLTTCVIISMFYLSAPASAGLVGKWSFDEGSGNVANDVVGDAQGALSSGARFVPDGIAGGGLRLDRSLQGSVSFGRAVPFTGSFTISVWIKTNPGDTSDSLAVISKHLAGYPNGFWININGTTTLGETSKAAFYQWDPYDIPTSTTTVNDGNWHHIVAVYAAGAQKCIYIDSASEDCARSERLDLPDAPLVLGAFSTPEGGRTGFFNGWMDELAIFDHALSSSEISALYANPAGSGQTAGAEIFPAQILFTNSLTITISNSVSAGQIHFRTNGTSPSPSSPIYLTPFQITNATTIRAAVFLNSFIISPVASRSYQRVYAVDDGISNDWRRQYFGLNFLTDSRVGAQEDPDRDGATNLEEFTAGTDPLDPRSAFRAAVKVVPQVTFPSQAGSVYRVWRKPALGGTQASLAGTVTAPGPETSFVDTNASGRVSYYFVELVR